MNREMRFCADYWHRDYAEKSKFSTLPEHKRIGFCDECCKKNKWDLEAVKRFEALS